MRQFHAGYEWFTEYKRVKNEEDVNEEVQRQPTMTNHNQVNWFIIIIFVGNKNKKKKKRMKR